MASGVPSTLIDYHVEVLKSLADPVRLAILTRIALGDEVACTDLVNEARVSASTVSYHVKILKAAGLVTVRKDGRNYYYTLRSETLWTLSAYVNGLAFQDPDKLA